MGSSCRWILAGVAWVICATAVAQSEDGVDAGISLEFTSYTLGEPVRARLIVTNRMNTPVQLELGRDRKENFAFVLMRPDGERTTLSASSEREGMFELGKISVAAGGRFDQMLLLNEWTTFNELGTYILEANLKTSVRTDAGQVVVPALRQAFVVAARDEVSLKQTCERLVQELERARSVRQARDAAFALVAIQDPLTVPYLELALGSKKYVEAIALDGLAAIADASAVRVLIAIANESTSWPPDANTTVGHRSLLANQALSRAAEKTTDQALKARILRAVRQVN
jgi:hypothetical protein